MRRGRESSKAGPKPTTSGFRLAAEPSDGFVSRPPAFVETAGLVGCGSAALCLVALGTWPLTKTGKITLSLPIPNVAALRGLTLSTQSVVLQGSGLSFTNAMSQKIQ